MSAALIMSTLFKSNLEPLGPDEIEALVSPQRDAIEALREGSLDKSRFVILCEVNLAAYALTKMMSERGSGGTKVALADAKPALRAFAEVLRAIGNRQRGAVGEYFALRDELECLLTGLAWYEEMLKFAPRHIVALATEEAKRSVDSMLGKRPSVHVVAAPIPAFA